MADRNDTPLSVLMTADTVGGVWTYCLELIRTLAPHGLAFHLVTSGAPLQEAQRRELAEIGGVTLYETGYKLEWMADPWADINASGAWLLELEKTIRPDIVHLNSFSYGSLPFRAPKVVVAHSDVWSWWQAVKGDRPTPDWNEYYRRVKSGLDGAGRVVAPSASMLEAVRQLYAPAAECTVIYNGRSASCFRAAVKEPRIMSMGRIWDEAKNVQLLVDAAAQIPYPIRIAGDNRFEDQEWRRQHPSVHYLGKLGEPEVARELSTAALYVLPARYEPFGLSALEAALSGCALVLGDIPSLREIWQDAAVFVDTGDAPALALAVNRLLEDGEKLGEYARRAGAQAQKYTAAAMARGYLKVYRQLLQKKNVFINQETA